MTIASPRRRWPWVLAGAGGLLLLMLVLAFLRGSETMKPEDFADSTPRFVLEAYFPGRTLAWGIFQDRFGTLRRQFQVDIDGSWDGETLTLDERFLYDDGERDRRVWRITRTGEHTYEGRADDIVGVARGTVHGNALRWAYDLRLPLGKTTLTVRFKDWMWLQPGGVLVNRATMSKWGATLGTVTLFFRKGEEGESLTQTTDG